MTKPLYFYNGSTFELVGPTTPQSPIAYQTSAPTAPATGDLWIDSDGDVDTYNRQLTRYYFVATAAQTTITGIDANGLTLAYVAGSEAVYVNGALQVRGQDYTATNGTSVVMSSGLAVNDVVEIFAYTAFTVANAYTKSETDGIAAAAAGLRMVVPTSVAVGSGSGSVDAIGNVTFSGASSISLNGCFSSAYDTYVINHSTTLSAGTVVPINFRMRVAGADLTSGVYKFAAIYMINSSSTINGDAGTAATSMVVSNGFSTNREFTSININNPFNAQVTNMTANGFGAEYLLLKNGYVNNTTSYDGFTLYPSSGTFTGTIRVYGYKD